MNALLKPEQVAERLAISPKMVRAWLRDGRIPGVRIGRLWRVDPDALETWIAGNAADARTEANKSDSSQPAEKTPQTRSIRFTRTGNGERRKKRPRRR